MDDLYTLCAAFEVDIKTSQATISNMFSSFKPNINVTSIMSNCSRWSYGTWIKTFNVIKKVKYIFRNYRILTKTISLICSSFEKVFRNDLYYVYRGKFPHSFNYFYCIFSHLSLTFLFTEEMVSESSKSGKVLIPVVVWTPSALNSEGLS